LIASGVQEWYSGVICCLNEKFVYCSTLALYIYRLTDHSLQRILTGHEKAITGIAKSPFVPNLVVTTSLDKTMKLWDVENGKMIKSITIDGDFKPTSLDWNPHSQFEIAVGGKKGHIRIYNYNSSKYKLLNLKSEADVQKVKYNPKSQDIFVFLKDGTIVLANTVKNSIIYRYKQIHESGIDFSFDPHSNNYVICAYKNGQLSLYDTDKPGEYFRVGSEFERRGGISCVAFLEDEPGSFISGDMRTGVIMYWNVSHSTPIKIVKLRKSGVKELYPIHGEKKFLISFKDGAVGIFNYKLEKLDFITNTGHTETIFDCAFCACNPNILATSSYDGTIKLWDISTMKEFTSLVVHGMKGIIYGLAWHPSTCILWCIDHKNSQNVDCRSSRKRSGTYLGC
jgi:WD40 repeat protein